MRQARTLNAIRVLLALPMQSDVLTFLHTMAGAVYHQVGGAWRHVGSRLSNYPGYATVPVFPSVNTACPEEMFRSEKP
jgi:hypothetical protein